MPKCQHACVFSWRYPNTSPLHKQRSHRRGSRRCSQLMAVFVSINILLNLTVLNNLSSFYQQKGRHVLCLGSWNLHAFIWKCPSFLLTYFVLIWIKHYILNGLHLKYIWRTQEYVLIFSPTDDNYCLSGNHGYDNIYKSMHVSIYS